jgi:hypothetical protein
MSFGERSAANRMSVTGERASGVESCFRDGSEFVIRERHLTVKRS